MRSRILAKKTAKTKANTIQKQKYLKTYLHQRNYTLKDLKGEIVLMICDMLLENYLYVEDTANAEELISDFTSDERNTIYNTMKDLKKDIQENILTIEKVQNIMILQNENKDTLTKARLADSTYYFYNTCINYLEFLITSTSIDKNKKMWIPDLICLYLIQDMKESGYTFNKFTFLDKYDFDSIFRIYEKINITFKKVGNLSMFSKEKTRIDIMSNISYEIVTKLINTKYK